MTGNREKGGRFERKRGTMGKKFRLGAI